MSERMAERFIDDNRCFGCGKRNPIGLKMEFAQHGSGWRSTFTPSPDQQGWRGVCHGGIVSTVLDEIMAQSVARVGITAVTARISVEFKRPVKTGEEYLVFGRFVEKRGRIIKTEAEMTDAKGVRAATAKGTYFVVGET
jgi:uncharacterized protein (TIGR00369 family)